MASSTDVGCEIEKTGKSFHAELFLGGDIEQTGDLITCFTFEF